MPESGVGGAPTSEGRHHLDRWERVAQRLDWDHPYERLWDPTGPVGGHPRAAGPAGSWFVGGRLNVAANCLDRHLAEGAGRVAYHWEGEPGDRRDLTYGELHAESGRFANALIALGVSSGERVALHLGLIPELLASLLGAARIGATCTLLPVSLPVEALAARLAVFDPKVVVTQDGAWRHGVVLPLTPTLASGGSPQLPWFSRPA